MQKLFATIVLFFGSCLAASADVWRWVDANGDTHYVDTETAIYTWVDELGKVHYSDTPEHEAAVAVQLMWVSKGSLDGQSETASEKVDANAYPGETAEQRDDRRQAEAYYCKRATEAYESYLNAPQLYLTNDDGEREILSEEQAATTIADTKKKQEQYCR